MPPLPLVARRDSNPQVYLTGGRDTKRNTPRGSNSGQSQFQSHYQFSEALPNNGHYSTQTQGVPSLPSINQHQATQGNARQQGGRQGMGMGGAGGPLIMVSGSSMRPSATLL